ncbi:hypothetical protein CYLTODRAFT_455253 [Cylindrobasidium torrendii FP15055 ss-10]|uniref:Uncharacterized protein n=1 Tax=Cylindrobasidium torrendii FP15055 ss-10 TaxID=1314674 RepID=A0A0D7B8L0_9AGAR|nr:hypothetical protein CYLTODRAFT_455253 [Cylindrobasidium torrendii FP15055 ss-10]
MDSSSFPMLESLSIEVTEHDPPVEGWKLPASAFKSVVTAIELSGAPLRAFQYSHGDCNDADIHRLINAAHGLELLVVHSIQAPSMALGFAHALAPEEGAIPLRLLRTLSLSGNLLATGHEQRSAEAIIELARRRWAAGALRELRIGTEGRVYIPFGGSEVAQNALATIVDGVRDCIAEGLVFKGGSAIGDAHF